MKKITALLLLVLLAVAPFSASMAANGHPESVAILDKTLNAANPYYKNGPTGGAGSLVTVNDDWNAYYDATNGVLTLKNLNVSGSSSTVSGMDFDYGIYAAGDSSNNLTIKLEGNNIVSTADSRSKNPCAVRINCNLMIQGGGALTIRAGKATAAGVDTSSYALMAYSITQTGGTIKATGGNAVSASSYGVHVMNAITVKGGSLTGVGGLSGANQNAESVGVLANGGITVSGGSLTGIGSQARTSARSRGVYGFGGYSITGGRLVAKAEAGGSSLLRQPNPLPTAYSWRTSDSAGYTQFPPQAYVWDAAQTYVDIRTSLPSAGEAVGTGSGVPRTGDAATPMLWLLIILLAGTGLTVSAVRRRKRRNG